MKQKEQLKEFLHHTVGNSEKNSFSPISSMLYFHNPNRLNDFAHSEQMGLEGSFNHKLLVTIRHTKNQKKFYTSAIVGFFMFILQVSLQ